MLSGGGCCRVNASVPARALEQNDNNNRINIVQRPFTAATVTAHYMDGNMTELDVKQHRLAEFLDRHRLEGVLLQRRNNFAWITCGRDNHIANNSPAGVAAILATRDGRRICFTNTVEAPRFEHEELIGTGINVVSHKWFDAKDADAVLRQLIAGRKIAADVEDLGGQTNQLPGDFAQLRWSLTDEELNR